MNPAMNPAAGPTLHDIHLPPPPGWWPPAPGWWLFGLATVLCCIFVFKKLYKIRNTRRTRKAVMTELDRHIDAARGDPTALAAALSQFLRRMVLRDTPAAAALPDERWLRFLDSYLIGDEFARGVGRVLLDAPFRPESTYDAPALIALVRRWTRNSLDTAAGRV